MVNRFFRRSPYDIGLYVPPVDAIKEALQTAQKQYDTNYLLSQTVKHNFINSLPQDRALANEIQRSWETRVDDIVNSAQGDYSKIGKQLGTLMSEIRKEYNPGGKAHAITSNFNNYSQWIKEHQDRVAKGDVLAEDLNLANNYYMTRYQGVGDIDPVTGSYNRFNPEFLADYQDPNKIIQDTFKEFKPEKKKVGVTSIRDGMIYYDEKEVEGISEERLFPSFSASLQADPKFATYIQQRSKFMGDPSKASSFIQQYSAQRARDLSYLNKSSIQKGERDPLAVARTKAALDKKNIDYMMSFQQYGEVTKGLLQSEPSFDPDDWRSDITSIPTGEYTGQTPFGGAPLIPAKRPDITTPRESLANFIAGKNDEKIQAKWNVSPELMRAHWEQKKQWTPEFATKYGKDPRWTAEYEKNFMWDVKKLAPDHSAYQIVEQEIAEPARDQNLLRAVRGAISNQWPVTRPGTLQSTVGLPKEIKDLIYDEKGGKLKNLDVLDIVYVQPGPGVKAAGYKIATPKGSVIIEDQNASRKAHSDRMAAAFNPIFFQGRKLGGAPVTYDVAGNQLLRGKPYREFEINKELLSQGQVKYDENIYMVERWSTENNPIFIYEDTPHGKQRVRRTAAQIAELELPEFAGALGYGSSKAEQTMNPFFLYGQ